MTTTSIWTTWRSAAPTTAMAMVLAGLATITATQARAEDGVLERVAAVPVQSESAAPDMPSSVSIIMQRAVRIGVPAAAPAIVQPAAQSDKLVAQIADRWRIDPHLLGAMVRAESGGKIGAVSNKGALGLLQVMPATARSMGVADPQQLLSNPALALETGAAYLKTLQARLGNDVKLVVAAYNAGPGAVLRAGMRVPGYRETQAYVGKVMASYAAARATSPR